jgi:hypothetical protein
MRSEPLHIVFAIAITCASCASPVESAQESPAPRAAEPPSKVAIGRFSEGSLAGWEERSFSGSTSYEFNQIDAREALSASCNAAASGLHRQGRIDLDEAPYLHWSWRVDRIYGQDLDEHKKSGDDFPARVFVVVKGGMFGLQTRALNYVWSSSQDSGARWSSPYSDRVKMIAVDAGPEMGAGVERLPVVETTWERWKQMHPDTMVISDDTGHSRNYQSYPYGNYRTDDDNTLRATNPAPRDTYAGNERVLGLVGESTSRGDPHRPSKAQGARGGRNKY